VKLHAPRRNENGSNVNVAKHKSESVANHAGEGKPLDARALRTRKQIDAAFVALLHRRIYDDIKVSDITRKAAVGRATFYAHYDSKDALLRSQLERIVTPMLVLRPEVPCLLDCRPFFDHIRTAPILYKTIMAGGGSRIVREAFEGHLDKLVTSSAHAVDPNIPAPLMKRFLVSAMLTIVAHTLNNDAQLSAAEMQRLFEKLAGSGLSY
jgi:AcrR family transcriptional regulator